MLPLTRTPRFVIAASALVALGTWFGMKTDESASDRTRSEAIPASRLVSKSAEFATTSPTGNLSATAKRPEASPAQEDSTPGHTAKDSESHRFFGIGEPLAIADLPDGKLKEKLLTLTPNSKATALEWLQGVSFNGIDAVNCLRADHRGGIFYACSGAEDHHQASNGQHASHAQQASVAGMPEPVQKETETETENASETVSAGVEKAPVPISSPPAYNSRPGSTRHIYLDFNGAYVTGKQWTATDGQTTWDTWDCEAWSSDGDKTTFSDAEQRHMREVWERIAEDFAPFDVNVTTDVTFDVDNYTGNKNNVGWLLVTPTVDKNGAPCPHFGSGGVAYLDKFGDSDYFSRFQPAWVTPYDAAETAEVASHEMGHNLGLSHDGTSNLEYYRGHGALGSPISWGPIMGASYDRTVSQWSKGEYFNSNQKEDDLSIIGARIPPMFDDHGDTISTATSWSSDGDGLITQSGLIETTDDPDVFEFTTGAGTIIFDAETYKSDFQTAGNNLDIELELRDSGGNIITSNHPDEDPNASISHTVATGTYYLFVRPSGAGSPLSNTPSGFTSYGSLGNYTITGSTIPPDEIVLRSLDRGGSVLAGFKTEIRWASGIAGNVKIELFKGGVRNSVIASSVANDGSFDWYVPSTQQLGSDYKIKITSLGEPEKFDESETVFAINRAPASFTLPYAESFESGTGDWIQSASDDFNWTHNRFETTSTETGPGKAQDRSWYLYTEASEPRGNPVGPGDEAILTCWFNLTSASSPQLKFFYHMYGSGMGSLQLDARIAGSDWENLFAKSGNQGDRWISETVNLSRFEGGLVELRLKGIIGSDFRSDIGIDNMTISGSGVAYDAVYFGNGNDDGVVPEDTNRYVSGSTVTVLGNAGDLTKIGHVFSGWNTAADGSGDSYLQGDTLEIGASNIFFHAQWTAVPPYTVSFDGNGSTGGTVPVEQTKIQGLGLILSDHGSLVKTDHTFTGWNTASNGSGTSYAAGGEYADDADITLYAQWAAIVIPPSFDNWLGDQSVTGDSNGDGIRNMIAWVLGASGPSVNASALLPTLDHTTDEDYVIYTYRRSDEAFTAESTTISAQYATALNDWTSAVPNDPEVIITESDDFYRAGVDKVEVKIRRSLEVDGKLFLRLKVNFGL